MLLLLIPIAWLVVVTVLVAVCRAAGRAGAPRSAAGETPSQVIDGLVVWDPVAARALRAHYARRRVRGNGRGRELSGGHARARELRTRAPGVRQVG